MNTEEFWKKASDCLAYLATPDEALMDKQAMKLMLRPFRSAAGLSEAGRAALKAIKPMAGDVSKLDNLVAQRDHIIGLARENPEFAKAINFKPEGAGDWTGTREDVAAAVRRLGGQPAYQLPSGRYVDGPIDRVKGPAVPVETRGETWGPNAGASEMSGDLAARIGEIVPESLTGKVPSFPKQKTVKMPRAERKLFKGKPGTTVDFNAERPMYAPRGYTNPTISGGRMVPPATRVESGFEAPKATTGNSDTAGYANPATSGGSGNIQPTTTAEPPAPKPNGSGLGSLIAGGGGLLGGLGGGYFWGHGNGRDQGMQEGAVRGAQVMQQLLNNYQSNNNFLNRLGYLFTGDASGITPNIPPEMLLQLLSELAANGRV